MCEFIIDMGNGYCVVVGRLFFGGFVGYVWFRIKNFYGF